MARAAPTPPERKKPVEEISTIELIRQILVESSNLVQKEFQLLREETTLAIRRTGIASGKLVAGSILIILAAGFLGFSLIFLLSAFITPWLSAAIVGLVFLIAGAILGYLAVIDFKRLKIAPQTAETLKEDAEWLRHPTRPEGK